MMIFLIKKDSSGLSGKSASCLKMGRGQTWGAIGCPAAAMKMWRNFASNLGILHCLVLLNGLQVGGPGCMDVAGPAGVRVGEAGVVTVEGEAGDVVAVAVHAVAKNRVVNGR